MALLQLRENGLLWHFCHHDIIYTATTPRLVRKGGVLVSILSSFIISVMASVVAYYICKWLNGDE